MCSGLDVSYLRPLLQRVLDQYGVHWRMLQ
jgi:hypothetical protein